jgi:hypothetical protein
MVFAGAERGGGSVVWGLEDGSVRVGEGALSDWFEMSWVSVGSSGENGGSESWIAEVGAGGVLAGSGLTAG